jgi:hypothetical protein
VALPASAQARAADISGYAEQVRVGPYVVLLRR